MRTSIQLIKYTHDYSTQSLGIIMLDTASHVFTVCLPQVLHVIKSYKPSPFILHTASDQALDWNEATMGPTS